MTGKVMLRTVAAILIVVTIAGPCMAFPLGMLRPIVGLGRFGAKMAVSLLGRSASLFKSVGRTVFPRVGKNIRLWGWKVLSILPWVGSTKNSPKPSIFRNFINLIKRYWKLVIMGLGFGWLSYLGEKIVIVIVLVVLFFILWPIYKRIFFMILKIVNTSSDREEGNCPGFRGIISEVWANIRTLWNISSRLVHSVVSMCQTLVKSGVSEKPNSDSPASNESNDGMPEEL